jgi:hypothetical protein
MPKRIRPVEFASAKITEIRHTKNPDSGVLYPYLWAEGRDWEACVRRRTNPVEYDMIAALTPGAIVRIAGIDQPKPKPYRWPGASLRQIMIREVDLISPGPPLWTPNPSTKSAASTEMTTPLFGEDPVREAERIVSQTV